MSKTVITSDKAPAAIGTYSQAIKAGNTVYMSGQIPLDPVSMELVEGFEAQTVQVFENLKAVAEAAGGSFKDIVKLEHLPHRPLALRQGQRSHGPLLRAALPGACRHRRGRSTARRAGRNGRHPGHRVSPAAGLRPRLLPVRRSSCA